MKKFFSIIVVLFFINNNIHAQCSCGGTTNWFATEFRIGKNAPNKFKCGNQFTIKTTDTVLVRNGGYTCVGTTCTTKYKANIYNSSGRIIKTIDPFSFTSGVFIFSTVGSYKVELIAMCNNISCKPCYYYFSVK